ncbi:MAG TPA: NAD(P)/FAD-dependent oxidoreductase [Coleofasciculaceae cyanobacterium]|jgi:kynurenine 3-monooxygenase
MVETVAIIGAGPSGVLLAHYLLRRGDRYKVDIYERRSDPQTIVFSSSRTFLISLNPRGINALSNIEGLVEIVTGMSVESTGSVFHQTNGKTRFTPRRNPIFILDRTQLTIALLQKSTKTYDQSRLNLYFNHQCTKLDFASKTATFQKNQTAEITINYDLLIGADGAKSIVREKFLSTELFELEQKYIPTDYKSIFLPNSVETSTKTATDELKSGYVHAWRLENGTGVLMVHQLDGSMSGVITFPRDRNSVVTLATAAEVLQFFRQHFPEIGQIISESEAIEFLNRPVSSILTIICSHYHYEDSVLLIGDAAHAMSPSLGQGCNSAMEDAAIVDELLNEYSDNLAMASAKFTERRKSDAHAVVELSDNVFPSFNKKLIIEFIIRQQLAQILHRLFPKYFSPSLLELISGTTIPYSTILSTHRRWISRVKKANRKFLERAFK